MTKVRTNKAPLILQVADVLQRARKLPVGAARDDLRQEDCSNSTGQVPERTFS